ncbi:NADPH-dependent 7-cyano-7-deazaguanine reductase QueF [Silanimonas sp.]|uniref:NADPH-dependent 7-cyano-7-deazaguanine reductase QueF n=1 Tax=Silanimonas sp. TaxID=1929290 RepID=UPI0022C97EBF|nr:NADPH-dependent 7-cyano-7-deazaguanine reductase QueF [Silanimonas sp.]MCZ8166392.1 NADPH-dependent 7-cyano-7-deazaguanine reductase QueF [Silanimonas sp.]
MNNTPETSTLGQSVAFPSSYDAGLLFPIPRTEARSKLGLDEALPFVGVDLWNAYELSWLDLRGKPQVALAEFRVPATSPNLVESKSFKLYLNSFAQERLANADALRATLIADLSAAAGASVSVSLIAPTSPQAFPVSVLPGELIDGVAIAIEHYGPPAPELLKSDAQETVEETLVSHLFRSNCPVTGQPDWASLQIAYTGPRIDRAALLRYLVSFRTHSDFHEACVERIFLDLRARCAPVKLSVYARFTRRGGLDINPFRALPGAAMPDNLRLSRQ